MGCEEKQFAFVVVIYRRGKEEAKRENRAGSLFLLGHLLSLMSRRKPNSSKSKKDRSYLEVSLDRP